MSRLALLAPLLAALGCVDRGAEVGPLAPNAPPPDARPAPPEGADGGAELTAPLSLRFEVVAQDSGALRVTDLAFLPAPYAGHLLLLEKDGEVIHLRPEGEGFKRLGAFPVPQTWADSDAGLVSVAVDPDFERNRFIFLGLTVSQETNVVRRYTFDPRDYAATATSGVTILEITGPGSPRSWHNVGSIGFTEEGYLWALFGDKVLDAFAEDPASPLGSVLRVIPSRRPGEGGFTVPPDNPFAAGGGHPAVWAKGLRSPWKGLYRDGTYFVGDVGLDKFEELNRVRGPAADLGWPTAEGPCPAEADCQGRTDPWIHYGRADDDPFRTADVDATPSRLRSIYVGWLYQPGPEDPYAGRWDGVLTFGDTFAGWVRGVRVDDLAAPPVSWHLGHILYATGWAQSPDGYVYVSALGTWPVDAPVAPSPIYRAVLDD